MASRRRITSTAHEWTEFEKHTLLCLMAKGMHLEERGQRNDEAGAMRRHAYLNVATELNKAVNGANDFGNDIDKKEVAKMIDRMLVEKKGVVGKGGYMERATRGRITRGLKRMWQRKPGFDYDGSQSEWKQWRREREVERKRVADGGTPKDGVTVDVVEPVEEDAAAPEIVEDIWHQAGAAALDRLDLVNHLTAARTLKPTTSIQDSFNHLPARLRGNEKYAWANPITNNRSSNAGDSYRPSSSSMSSGAPHQSSTRYESTRNSYHPPNNPQHASENLRSPYALPSNSQYNYTTRNEPFDRPQDNMSTRSLNHDYLSSPGKISSYSGTGYPTSTYEAAHLARSIQHEMSQRKSSEYKKPGILKHRTNLNNTEDQTLGDKIDPARRAMLAEPDVEKGEIIHSGSTRVAGTRANNEDMPFNRLESRRYGGGSDTEMDEDRY